MFYLYKIINKINEKFYIGKTNNIFKRWEQHKYDSKNNSKLLIHKAIRKYGIENFEFIVLNKFDSDKEVCEAEIFKIKSSDKNMIYNIALGGNGGNTMSIEKINSQYSIGEDRYDEFILLFNQHKTQLEISKIMNVGKNSVVGCAKRLNLSFRKRIKVKNKVKNKVKTYKYICKYNKEERSSIWRNNIICINKKRGISEDLKKEILFMYFNNNETGIYIANFLNITRSVVRGVVNREYKIMDEDIREEIKKKRKLDIKSLNRNINLKIINENL
jgi:group I intron endonuclease